MYSRQLRSDGLNPMTLSVHGCGGQCCLYFTVEEGEMLPAPYHQLWNRARTETECVGKYVRGGKAGMEKKEWLFDFHIMILA